jgi:protein TonB
MFERLVVSTTQRHKTRTAKFFVCTSLIYLITFAASHAVSLLLADTKLVDPNNQIVLIAPLRAPAALPQPVGSTPEDSVVARYPDPGHLMRYDESASHHQNIPMKVELPAVVHIGGEDDVLTGDRNGFPNIADIIREVRDSEGRASDPPSPPDPSKPQPRTIDYGRPVPVPSRVLQGKAIDRVVPIYPDLPKRIRLQGDVSIEVIISAEGRVESARVVSGHPMLVRAALDAARGWKFGPTILNGVPVAVSGVITFVFKIVQDQ